MSKVPLTESNFNVKTTPSKHESIKSKTTSTSSPSKHCQSSSSHGSPTIKNRAIALGGDPSLIEKSNETLNFDAKENDLAVEINITTGSNVQVMGIFFDFYPFIQYHNAHTHTQEYTQILDESFFLY